MTLNKWTRAEIYKLIFERYEAEPEFMWKEDPRFGVFRHFDNRKWFAIIMDVKPALLKMSGEETVDIINVKIDPADIYDLLQIDGILPAYHMNKKHWVSVVLDGRVKLTTIIKLLDVSFELTRKKYKAKQ